MNTATATQTDTFQVGTTYTTRSAADSNCIFRFTVTKRTAKFITVLRDNGADGELIRVGVKTDERGEWALPLGSFSMAPVIRADRVDY
jgi:hypothetical protein